MAESENDCGNSLSPETATADKSGVSLTEKAAQKAKEIMQNEGLPSDTRLRIRIVGGGCSGFNYDLFFDISANSGDKIFKSFDLEVVVDQMSLLYLAGTEIDYVENEFTAGFKFNNPNVKATCGCGSSFQV